MVFPEIRCVSLPKMQTASLVFPVTMTVNGSLSRRQRATQVELLLQFKLWSPFLPSPPRIIQARLTLWWERSDFRTNSHGVSPESASQPQFRSFLAKFLLLLRKISSLGRMLVSQNIDSTPG